MHHGPALQRPESLWATDQKGLWSPEAGEGAPACLQHRSVRYAKGLPPLPEEKMKAQVEEATCPVTELGNGNQD